MDQHQGLVDQDTVFVDLHPVFGGPTPGFGGSTPMVSWINTRVWWINTQCLVDQHLVWWIDTRFLWIDTQGLVIGHPQVHESDSDKDAEVEMFFKGREGEARVWQAEPEQWLPVDAASGAALLELESIGTPTHPSTAIGRALDQRTDEFYNSNFECTESTYCQYRRRTLMEFDHRRPSCH